MNFAEKCVFFSFEIFRNLWMNSLLQKSLKAESLENLLDSSWKTLAKILSSMDNL